ncbi:unnamed protein product [Staurois parvus]|uniref:Uncharacterized protein n=1 Tax=Staurois parvus TaxID=386267 RepID=A0ABN9B082_9NEOB|nr:unnamed protein product [Staurois parvus]
MVGVTSQGSEAGEMVRQSQGSEQGSATNQTGTGTGSRNRIQGPGETHTKAESAGLVIP